VDNKFCCFVSVYLMLHLYILFFFKIIMILILGSVVWACVTYKFQEFRSYIFCYFFILRLGIIGLKYQSVGWKSIVNSVTHCGLDSSEIESHWGKIFCTCSDQP